MRKSAEWSSRAGALEEIKTDAFFLGVDLNDEIQIVTKFAVCTTAALIFSEIKADLAFGFLGCI